MPALLFTPAATASACAAMAGLEAEYLQWVDSELSRTFAGVAPHGTAGPQSQGATAATTAQRGLPLAHAPRGVAYLIEVDGQPAGMCGLRPLAQGTVAEVKRLYVRPAYRGLQLGQLALRKLLADAGRLGYPRICLDTAPFMQAAHRLYEAHGFTDCAAYDGTEVPPHLRGHWRFMQRAVPGPPHLAAAPPGA